MANVKIHCPNCHQEYDVDEAALGHEAECEACKKTFVLQADVPSEPPRRKTKMTVSVEKKTSLKHMKCEMCGGSELVKQDGLFVCQHCGAKYTVEEARKMMVEGDGDVVVSGTVKIDDKEKLENLYTLARREYNFMNYEEALKYYEAIIIEDPNNWEPVFMTSYLKIGRLNDPFEYIADNIDNYTRKLYEAIKLLKESEDNSDDKLGTLRGLLVKSTKLISTYFNMLTKTINEQRIQNPQAYFKNKLYVDNSNSMVGLIEEILDIACENLPEEESSHVMNLLKSVCKIPLADDTRIRIMQKIWEKDPSFSLPKEKEKKKIVLWPYFLFVFILLIIILFTYFRNN